jgi:hypothetical protein
MDARLRGGLFVLLSNTLSLTPFAALLSLTPLALGCSSPADNGDAPGASTGSPAAMSLPELEVVSEQKLSKIVDAGTDHHEASGVCAQGGYLYVVFDNMKGVAKIPEDLTPGVMLGGVVETSHYEGITFDGYGTPHFYVIKETDNDNGQELGKVIQLDAAGALEGDEWTDAAFSVSNKGFEGLAWVRAAGDDYLLGLCEGNFCQDDNINIGNGKLRVMRQQNGAWVTTTTLDIPAEARFRDYSDIALRENGDGTYKVAIVSQESSALWLGTLATSPSFAFTGQGAAYAFPKAADGSVVYCNIEGVTFMSDTLFAMVSDESDGSTPCNDKDEMAHIVRVPSP